MNARFRGAKENHSTRHHSLTDERVWKAGRGLVDADHRSYKAAFAKVKYTIRGGKVIHSEP